MSRRRIIGAVLVALVLLAGFALSRAGTALSASDPLQPADAIVVINGRIPYRAMKGAELYERHLAPEVWLTVGNRNAAEVEMEKIDVHPIQEHVYSQQVLEKLGVPTKVIHVLPARNRNTADEMRTIASPCVARWEIVRCTSAFAPTSTPRVGSSRMRTRGSAASHLERTTFC